MNPDCLIEFLLRMETERIEELSTNYGILILAFSEGLGKFVANLLIEPMHHLSYLLLLLLDLLQVVLAELAGSGSDED